MGLAPNTPTHMVMSIAAQKLSQQTINLRRGDPGFVTAHGRAYRAHVRALHHLKRLPTHSTYEKAMVAGHEAMAQYHNEAFTEDVGVGPENPAPGTFCAITPWIGVDFDKTLTNRETAIPRMAARVRRWLTAGKDVRICTARVASTLPDDVVARHRAIIEKFCMKYFGRKLVVTAEKDPGMRELWDDKARRVRDGQRIFSVSSNLDREAQSAANYLQIGHYKGGIMWFWHKDRGRIVRRYDRGGPKGDSHDTHFGKFGKAYVEAPYTGRIDPRKKKISIQGNMKAPLAKAILRTFDRHYPAYQVHEWHWDDTFSTSDATPTRDLMSVQANLLSHRSNNISGSGDALEAHSRAYRAHVRAARHQQAHLNNLVLAGHGEKEVARKTEDKIVRHAQMMRYHKKFVRYMTQRDPVLPGEGTFSATDLPITEYGYWVSPKGRMIATSSHPKTAKAILDKVKPGHGLDAWDAHDHLYNHGWMRVVGPQPMSGHHEANNVDLSVHHDHIHKHRHTIAPLIDAARELGGHVRVESTNGDQTDKGRGAIVRSISDWHKFVDSHRERQGPEQDLPETRFSVTAPVSTGLGYTQIGHGAPQGHVMWLLHPDTRKIVRRYDKSIGDSNDTHDRRFGSDVMQRTIVYGRIDPHKKAISVSGVVDHPHAKAAIRTLQRRYPKHTVYLFPEDYENKFAAPTRDAPWPSLEQKQALATLGAKIPSVRRLSQPLNLGRYPRYGPPKEPTGARYQIHPEFELRYNRDEALPKSEYRKHIWDVVHTPTRQVTHSFQIGFSRRIPSVDMSHRIGESLPNWPKSTKEKSWTMRNKGIGRLAYHALAHHYGLLTSDSTGSTSKKAARVYKDLGAARLNSHGDGHPYDRYFRPQFLLRGEPLSYYSA